MNAAAVRNLSTTRIGMKVQACLGIQKTREVKSVVLKGLLGGFSKEI